MDRREGAEMHQHRRRGRRRPNSCARCCQKLCGTVFSNIGICIIIIGYIVLGAFMFMSVEGGHELAEMRRQEAERRAADRTASESRRQAVEKLWNITMALNVLHKEKWTSLTSRELKKFQQELINVSLQNRTEPIREQWSFCGSFLYSLTVITTIGYGTCSPKTDTGKLLTIAYAVIGIPLMLIYLSNVGDILARCLKFLFDGCCLCQSRGSRQKKRVPIDAYRPSETPTPPRLNHIDGELKPPPSHHHNHQHHHAPPPQQHQADPDLDEPEEPGSALPFCLCLLAMLGYILGGGVLLTVWEDWTYLDGTFFCFVSLSTIGFGELTPGVTAGEHTRLSQLVAALYLLLGMALIAMCFNLMQEQVVCLIRCIARHMGLFPEEEEETEAGGGGSS